MSRISRKTLVRSLAALAVAAMGTNASAAVVHAWGTADAGRELIERISRGDVSAAFDSALQLVDPRSEWFPDKMQHEREAVARDLALLGAPVGPVTQVTELPFGQSVLRDYRVKFANGEQRWSVKFRRGSDGWHLTELHARTFPKNMTDAASAASP